mmetsp:Transcript_37907/g.51292  ORF Transcript_37907/g.51292 Transcript_37907/m.51292 type:complete len:202 (-) Transcript_37907:64-669(-)
MKVTKQYWSRASRCRLCRLTISRWDMTLIGSGARVCALIITMITAGSKSSAATGVLSLFSPPSLTTVPPLALLCSDCLSRRATRVFVMAPRHKFRHSSFSPSVRVRSSAAMWLSAESQSSDWSRPAHSTSSCAEVIQPSAAVCFWRLSSRRLRSGVRSSEWSRLKIKFSSPSYISFQNSGFSLFSSLYQRGCWCSFSSMAL